VQEKDAAGFKKAELAAILKFGAEELFAVCFLHDGTTSPFLMWLPLQEDPVATAGGATGAASAVSKELSSLDIDELLARAETRDPNADEAQGAGAELLSAFKVASFSQGTRARCLLFSVALTLCCLAEKEGPAEEGAEGAAGEKEDAGFWDRVIKPEQRNSQVATVLPCFLRRTSTYCIHQAEAAPDTKRRRAAKPFWERSGSGMRTSSAALSKLCRCL
jgi:hypothetical protein